jgi:hypothetical protein
MSKPRVTKRQAEQAIFDRFKNAYLNQYGSKLINVNHRDRPDFSAIDSTTGRKIGIEVTGVYQDSREAEINYWLSGDWGIIIGDVDGLVDNINRSLDDKSQKASSYDKFGPLVLAIWIGSFIFKTKTDINYIESDLVIPKNPYSLIAFIIKDDRYQKSVLHILQEIPGWRNPVSA